MKKTILYGDYPTVIKIKIDTEELDITSVYPRDIYITSSPLGNCQTFTLGSAYSIRYVKKELMDDLIKIIYNINGKTQFLIDLLDTDIEGVFNKLEPYLDPWREKISYENLTHSKMTLFLLRFDKKKIEQLMKQP